MERVRPIQRLSAEVIGQIAAGEVVERPASAVKELVENSIDAGATAITVELREGGIAYLRVSDNGRGIPSSQIRMAFERHATSKIIRPEDLFDVHTLGFRGEALASIAAVSKVTLTTRTAAEDFGVRAQVEAGEMEDVREAATPVGTTILVQELFYNTPVRLKFLKKPTMEASLVSDYMMRLILSRPDISFRLVNQGKTVYQSVGDGNVESALYCVLGKDATRQMKRVRGTMNGLVLDGYVGVGELSRGNRQLQSFFLNGRYFRDATLSKSLESACQGLVMVGRFPCCALYLQLPYEQVDVNVHPNKLEMRFQNLPMVAQALETLVQEAMRSESLGDRLAGVAGAGAEEDAKAEFKLVVLEGSGEGSAEAKTPAEIEEGRAEKTVEAGEPGEVRKTEKDEESTSLAKELAGLTPISVPLPMPTPLLKEGYAPVRGNAPPLSPPPPAKSEGAPIQLPVQQEMPLSEKSTPSFHLVGVAFQTYWLFEAGERLLWVDQHAAHERILYDRLWARYEGEHLSQSLLTPLLVGLTAQECALVEEMRPVMEAAGFVVEPFDHTSVAVHAIPTIFGRNESARELLLEALGECQAQRGQVTRERMRKQVMQMACKRAIKAGDALTDAEMSHLMEEMLTTGIMPTCPHGRPIVVEARRRDLEKQFKRIL